MIILSHGQEAILENYQFVPLLDVSFLGRKTLYTQYTSFLWKLHPTRHNTRQTKWLCHKQCKSLVYFIPAGSLLVSFPYLSLTISSYAPHSLMSIPINHRTLLLSCFSDDFPLLLLHPSSSIIKLLFLSRHTSKSFQSVLFCFPALSALFLNFLLYIHR